MKENETIAQIVKLQKDLDSIAFSSNKKNPLKKRLQDELNYLILYLSNHDLPEEIKNKELAAEHDKASIYKYAQELCDGFALDVRTLYAN